jgi:hypothetical protein
MFFSSLAPFAAVVDVPVTPGADEARRWAQEELVKKVYQDAKPGLAQTILGWLKQALGDFLNGMGSVHGDAALLLLVGLALVVAIAAVVIVRPRLNRRRRAARDIFEGAAALTAAQHRELAASAAERGDFGTAVSEQFRAIVRAAEERDVCAPSPGRTAAEVAADLERAFPAHGPALSRAAGTFNEVRYGHAEPLDSMYQELVAVDRGLAASAPVYTDGLVAL